MSVEEGHKPIDRPASTAGGDFRLRTGLVMLVLGVLLLVWAWGSWIYRTSVEASPSDSSLTAAGEVEPDPTAPFRALARLLLYTLALVIIVLFGSYGIVRWMRRSSTARTQIPNLPSSNEDVWSMQAERGGVDPFAGDDDVRR